MIDLYEIAEQFVERYDLRIGFIDSRICGFLRFAKDTALMNPAKTLEELKDEYIDENNDLFLDYIVEHIKETLAKGDKWIR